MTNLILGIIAFAGVVCAAWLSARENNRLKEQLDELQDENDRLHTAFDALNGLCNENDPAEFRYSIDGYLNFRAVVKRKGGLWCIIKFFNDADEDFNQREAEELLEILNSK